MIYLKWFTDLSKEEWDKLDDYEKKKIRADHYVNEEVVVDAEWVLAFVEWYKNGKQGEEPQPKHDWWNKRTFNGCDLYNAFMEGIKFGEDLVKNNIKYE